ncbi:MAG: helix-turn-helix domain-containing protein [Candidatus Zhuqueibacterota bacterium]
MDKISIVKRRQEQNSQTEHSASKRTHNPGEKASETLATAYEFEDSAMEKKSEVEIREGVERDSSRIDIALNIDSLPELNTLLHLSEIMQNGEEEAVVKVNRDDNNKVIFQFNIKQHIPFKTLTSEDVCDLLKISRATLYKNVHERTIQCFRIGNQIRFLESDVLDYVKKCMVKE